MMSHPWTKRQRMRAAMSRQCPDRIPTMPQICAPHAVAILCENYRRGIAEILEDPRRNYELMVEAARRYDVDGLRLFQLSDPVRILDDGDRMIALEPKTGDRIGLVDVFGGGHVVPDKPACLVQAAGDLGQISRIRYESLLQTRSLGLLKDAIARAHGFGFFVASSPGSFTMNFLSECRGGERALLDLMDEPDLAKQVMDVGLENVIATAKALVHCGVDALYIGDPSASASLISPAQFKEFCFPRYRAFCEELHKENVLIYLHICGNSKPILEMMADTGVDCIEPLDPLGGVEVADAKARVGHKAALMGGVNTLTLLNGTVEAVYEEALACCRSGSSSGGYILAAGDMVPDLSPKENVLALVRAAREFSVSGVS